MSYDFDLLALGCGPAGQRSAIQAAKLGRRAAVVERRQVGGVCVITGTIPSKTLREAILHLTGFTQRGIYGQSYGVKDEITVEDLQTRYRHVTEREIDVIRDQLARNHVALIEGTARFADPHTLSVTRRDGSVASISAETIVIAVGTRPARPPEVAFDGRTIFDSDDLLTIDRIPGSLVVVGGGVIGIEYASIFAALRTTALNALGQEARSMRELLPIGIYTRERASGPRAERQGEPKDSGQIPKRAGVPRRRLAERAGTDASWRIGAPMNIGERRRTIYIEPIEEPAAAPVEEPSPEIDPERSDPRPEPVLEPVP